MEVKELILNSRWNERTIKEKVSADMAEYIIQDIKHGNTGLNDKAWWTKNSTRMFTIKPTYDLLRQRKRLLDWTRNV